MIRHVTTAPGQPHLSKEWLTAAEIAAMKLPEMPTTKRGVNLLAKRQSWRERLFTNDEPMSRPRNGRGTEIEYHRGLFCREAQAELARRDAAQKLLSAPGQDGVDNKMNGRGAHESGHVTCSADAWAWFERLPEKRKAKAKARLVVLEQVATLVGGGFRKNDAVHTAARDHGACPASVYDWHKLVGGLARADWLPPLAPRHVGKTDTKECSPEAWEYLKADYLTTSRPSFEASCERLQMAAAEHGWQVPSERTLRRRLHAEVPNAVIVLKREGVEALRRLYPAQERDRSGFHALEAVNADGHKADVFVNWPGEKKPVRPVLLVVQDLYSGMIVAWRVGLVESAHLVQLAFGDVFREFGIPTYAWLDNGRGFASKWITGQQPNRYRFKVKPADPSGVLTQLGVEVHWATPYSGQSKPIERAFRDLCDRLWRHPAFVGAYTGNKPDAKPEDYGSKAVPLDRFLQVVGQGIALHNRREGRRSRVCGGQLSFNQAFDASFAQAPIRKAVDEQLRMFLLAAESVTARAPAGAVHVLGNRYWADFLTGHVGKKLIVRFDPDALHDGVQVERLDGARLGFAACWAAEGFADLEAARTHARARRSWMRAYRDMAAAEITLTAAEAAALVPDIEPAEPPEARVVRPIFGNTATALAQADPAEDFDFDAAFAAGLKLIKGGQDEI